MLRHLISVAALSWAGACSVSPPPSPDFPTAGWRFEDGRDAPYLIGPGDTVEITVHSAPELSRSVIVGPDGRIRLPLAGAVPAAARTPKEVARKLTDAYREQLKSPDIDLIVTEFASQQVFVGGAVASPGAYDLPGQIDILQATMLAGGITDRGRTSQIVLLRRLPGGDVRTAVLDLRAALNDPDAASWLPLRRFDVVYVPRTRIANQNTFIRQYVRGSLPIDFSLFYDVSGDSF
jgi:protein involved in polysaccharide export with SLBB domain